MLYRTASTRLAFLLCIGSSAIPFVMTGDARGGNSFAIRNEKFAFPLTPSVSLVSINNRLGDVRVRTSAVEQVDGSAIIQNLSPSQGHVEVRSVSQLDHIEISIVSPSGQDFKGRVDVGVVVPSRLMIKVEAAQGLIEAKGLRGKVTARSTGGNIFLKASGPIDATTRSGNIFAWITAPPLASGSMLKTDTGDITLRFSQPADLKVKVGTQGSLSLSSAFHADDSLAVQAGPRSPILFGRGTNTVEIESRLGNIEIVVDQSSAPSSSNPGVIMKDLRNLPEAPAWQPGEPIVEVPKRSQQRN